MNNRLEFLDVTKSFGDFRALNKLSFSLAVGEVVGLLGHNGAGKTTSMKLALGLFAPSAGEVSVMGKNPRGHHSEQLRRNVGYLPENVSFYQQLTGREVLRYFSRLKGQDVQCVDRLLQQVGLGEAADRRIKTYSKGMRQRIGLAQALIGRPRLLLLDEPTAGLDPQATGEFYGLLDTLRADGVSILISSHVLPGVERHIDRAIIMGHGELRAQGSLENLRRQAQLPTTIRVQLSRQVADFSIPRLDSLGYRAVAEDGCVLKLQGPTQNKMAAIRQLVDMPAVADFEVIQPTLENLYAHFNTAHAPADVATFVGEGES